MRGKKGVVAIGEHCHEELGAGEVDVDVRHVAVEAAQLRGDLEAAAAGVGWGLGSF